MNKPEFIIFYRAYVTRIYKFVFYRVGGNKELAQDLTQDIFIKAFQAFERYDPAISESSWIYTIARNHLINQHAKQKAQIGLEEIEDESFASHDDRERFTSRHDEQALLARLNDLPPDESRLIRMKYLEGWSFEDLEHVFQKTSGALRVQAGRILTKLKRLLKNPYE